MLPCGGIVNDTKGRITAPDNDNDGLYDARLNCSWTILKDNETTRIELSVHVIDIECDFDYIEVMKSYSVVYI